MTAPLLSVVMPVRNGMPTFERAMASALEQEGFDDYEVVAVDNASTDGTPQVIGEMHTTRLSSHRHSVLHSMPDNFESAWPLARGRWVMFLCDDDCLLPDSLARVAAEIERASEPVVTWEFATYHHPDWHTPDERNNAHIFPAEGTSERIAVAELSAALYSFREPRWAPRMQNCCARRELLEGVARRLGRVFRGPCPDYAFLAAVCATVEAVRVVHRPLYLAGRAIGSIGAIQATTLGDEAERFLSELAEEGVAADGPCGIPVIANLIAVTLLNLRPVLDAAGLPAGSLDLAACFQRATRNLLTIERYTGRREELRCRLEDAARLHGPAIHRLVATALASDPVARSWHSRLADRLIGSSELLTRLEVRLRFAGDLSRARRWLDIEPGVSWRNGELHVRGETLGARHIGDMARHIGGLFDRYHQGPP